MSEIDYAEALRLIRKHMQPGDTLGQMFMRVAKELEADPMQEALRSCKTVMPSIMTGEEAIERLRQINRNVHDALA